MKKIVLLVIGIFLMGCQSNQEEARQPIAQVEVEDTLAPITENIMAHSVLYEANIRQYSNEGTLMLLLRICLY